MATIVFSSIGGAVGGPIGRNIGAFVGRSVDAALFGGSAGGARLRELDVTLSSYGQPLPRHYGRMRVAGSVIWATELEEHIESGGLLGGSGGYSYTANFAVALASRPLVSLGRIWADGKLLRGAAGDLKVGGTLRLHAGGEGQQPDPLIVAHEGADQSPAFRGLAYVVFEQLELASFGNRIPSLTFEVFADAVCDLGRPALELLGGADLAGDERGACDGFSVEDTLADTLAAIAPVVPVSVDGAAERPRIVFGDDAAAPIVLAEPARAGDDRGFGKDSGEARRRDPPEAGGPAVLRYFDSARDYLPALQYPSGRAASGQPRMLELPATMHAGQARALVQRAAVRQLRTPDRLSWRSATCDPAVAPGTLVRLADRPGTWRVAQWQWSGFGIELELAPWGPLPLPGGEEGAPGRFAAPADLLPERSRVVACELPWNAQGALPDRARLAIAVSGAGPGWTGAALYAGDVAGQLWPLGGASRRPAALGTVADALPPAGSLLLDRVSRVTVTLADPSLALASLPFAAITEESNLALIGEELVQFLRAEPLGDGRWRLSHLLRGCRGTEPAISTHVAGEVFALLDNRAVLIDAGTAGAPETVAALGRGDTGPALSATHLAGLSQRPLRPVHGRAASGLDGALVLSWTRRARGDWRWVDGTDVPVAEESERYLVTAEREGAVLRSWTALEPRLSLATAELAELAAGTVLAVRQQGTRGISPPLLLATLP
jgi:hypothetical protein